MDLPLLPPPTAEEAARSLDTARYRAAVALDHTILSLHRHLAKEHAGYSTRQLIDLGEHFAKVSGLLAKQERQATQSRGFKLNIVLNGGGNGVTIEAVPEVDCLADPPPLVTSFFPITNDLSCDDCDEQ